MDQEFSALFSASFRCQSTFCSEVIPVMSFVFIPHPNRKVKLCDVTLNNGLYISHHANQVESNYAQR